MSSVAAIVLGAGTASRWRAADGESRATKLVAELNGTPLVRHVVDAALASQARPIFVVTGHAQEAVRAALANCDVTFVHNPHYATGLASSLRVGLSALPDDVQGVLVLLGDMPLVSAATLNQLIDAFVAEQPDAVVPLYQGQRGNPALLGRSLFQKALTMTGDAGARALIASAAHVVETPIHDASVLVDLDTPDALARLKAAST